MDSFFTMLGIQMVLLLYVLMGIIAKKTGIITKENQKKFIDFVLMILLPCMVFDSFNQDLSVDMLKSMALVLATSFGVVFTGMLLGKVLYRNYPFEKRVIMQYATMINNASFAGVPLATDTYGALGTLYGSIFIIPNRICMWTAGISLFTPNTDWKTSCKKVLLNPNIIAVFLGLARSLLHIQLPGFMNTAITRTGACVAPMSMIVVGAILADVKLKSLWDKDVFYVSFVRLVVLPLLTLGVMRLLNFNETVTGISFILTAMPAGTTTALLAASYGVDEDFAAKTVFVTTALSLITVPILFLLL